MGMRLLPQILFLTRPGLDYIHDIIIEGLSGAKLASFLGLPRFLVFGLRSV